MGNVIFKITSDNSKECAECQKYFIKKFGVRWYGFSGIGYSQVPYLFVTSDKRFTFAQYKQTYDSIKAIPLPASFFVTHRLSKKDKKAIMKAFRTLTEN